MLNIYIISLKQDKEKRDNISKTLENFGLNFSFVDAVYGKELADDVLDYFRRKSVGGVFERGFPATSGEIGCTLSHLIAYQKVLDNNLEWACILEDDAILDGRFKTFISTFQDNGLDPQSLYLLGGQNIHRQIFVVKSIRNYTNIGGQKFSKTIRSEQFIYGTCCYLISLNLAKKFIKFSEKNFIVADDWNYLSKNGVFNYIYLANFVDHPIDFSASNLEEERRLGRLSKASKDSLKKTLLVRMKSAIKLRLKITSLNLYKYIEKKDNI